MSNNPMKRYAPKRKNTSFFEAHIIKRKDDPNNPGRELKLHATKGWRNQRKQKES